MVKYGKTESSSEEPKVGSSLSFSSSDSSTTSSDSEYYSPEETVGKNVKNRKVRRSPKNQSKVHHIPMTSGSPVGSDSASTSSENNAGVVINTAEYKAAMAKTEHLEKLVSDLTHERQQTLQTFIDEMKGVLGDGNDLADAAEGAQGTDFLTLMKRVKKEAVTLKFQLDSSDKEKHEMKQYIQECNANLTQLGEENVSLCSKIDELEKLPREHCDNAVEDEEKQALQSRLEDLVVQVSDLQNQNEKLKDEIRLSKNETEAERQILEMKINQMVNQVSCFENQNKELMEEKITISERNNEARNSMESRIEELVAQVGDLQNQNKEMMEEKITLSERTNEARNSLESRIEELVAQVGDLQNQNKEMMEKIKLSEKNNEARNLQESRKEEIVAQVGDLQKQNKTLKEEIVSSKIQRESLMDQVAIMQQEMDSLNKKERELMEQINTIQAKRLRDEMARSREMGDITESYKIIKDLKLEVDLLNKQKRETEGILKETREENCQLIEKTKELDNRIYDLEKTLVQRADRVSELEREISELSTKLTLRDEEFNSLQSQKTQLELKISRDREGREMELKNKSLAKEREEKQNNGIINKDFEKIKGWFKGSKPSLQVIERKMEELVEEFRKHMEDNIRLMSQRIRVTEQLHVENKESYKITKERLEQENRMLEARMYEYTQVLSTLDTATMRLKNVAEATNNMLTGLDLVCKQFDERNGRMMSRLSKFSEDLRYVKKWVVGTKKVNELLKGEVGGLVEQLQRKEENESLLTEKISVLLESKVDHISLVNAMEQVEKKMRGLQTMVREKENGILDMCEEKREAIRQLCVLIDYQKNRSDHFRQMVIQMHTVRTPEKTRN
uniref:Uncharacterized protein n=1 Tax=Kalanchoe fedtschenkoi TaxID=63787 RepID=A0A7N0UV16_KALFE